MDALAKGRGIRSSWATTTPLVGRDAEDEPSPVDAVCQQGFDGRIGSPQGMLGAGTYFADMASKADCYAGKYNPRGVPETDRGHVDYKPATMFLARVVLGCPYLTEQALEGIRRPPCHHGHFDPGVKDVSATHATSTPWSDKGLPGEPKPHG
ncbi:unnamed protein product [Prorocentrum cordatum]|uniref:PARP catalytic domain-containing protein n=1 Tax=Prorocentrum cordatum TaxID=2364126 RepID=A0ABN9SDI1_9DINO|nr:unnamed protein product [Polarella glacialis]